MATKRLLDPLDPEFDPTADPWADTPFANTSKSSTQGAGDGYDNPSQPDPNTGVDTRPTNTPPPPPATPPPPGASGDGGYTTPVPTVPPPGGPGGIVNTSPVTPPAPGAPGTYAPGAPNDPLWKETDPSKALLGMLNNKTAGGVSPSQLVDMINQHYPSAAAKYYNDSRGETIGFPKGYLSKETDGWHWTDRGPETGSTNGVPGASSAYPPPDYSNLDKMLQDMLQKQQQDNAARQAYNDKIHGSILDTINTNSKPVTADDPIITSQMAAYRGEQGRNTQLMREALAERNMATGGTSGALESGIKSTIEDAGNKTAGKEADSMVQELSQRRSALQAALSTGAGVLTADEDRNLRTTLAGIDAQLNKLSLQQGGNLGSSAQAIQYLLGDRSLTNQNNQFYDQFGANQANRQSELDRLLLQYLLGQ